MWLLSSLLYYKKLICCVANFHKVFVKKLVILGCLDSFSVYESAMLGLQIHDVRSNLHLLCLSLEISPCSLLLTGQVSHGDELTELDDAMLVID